MITEVSVAEVRYRLHAVKQDDGWMASATRADNGDRFGADCAGATEADALDQLRRWLHWQKEHAAALADLQAAERRYHRMIAGSAFANPSEGRTALDLQKESLEQVEAARVRLDEVRARRPE